MNRREESPSWLTRMYWSAASAAPYFFVIIEPRTRRQIPISIFPPLGRFLPRLAPPLRRGFSLRRDLGEPGCDGGKQAMVLLCFCRFRGHFLQSVIANTSCKIQSEIV